MQEHIRNIPNFPKKGVDFKDITPILKDPKLFKEAVDWFCSVVEKYPSVTKLVAVESRGFIFASAICYKLNLGLVIIRKKGKLPYKSYSVAYNLEYGEDTLEIHQDSFEENENIIIIDDLLATGGTVNASLELIKKTKANPVACIFFIELAFLDGKELVSKYQDRTNLHHYVSF